MTDPINLREIKHRLHDKRALEVFAEREGRGFPGADCCVLTIAERDALVAAVRAAMACCGDGRRASHDFDVLEDRLLRFTDKETDR